MAAPTIKQLEAFVHVADLGSFRRAAERLNTTQPNISTRIAGLEADLGVTLMERDAGSVRLTAKGRDLLGHARTVLADLDVMVASVGDTRLFDGVMKLGVTELVAQTWLRRFLKEMRSRFQNVDVELTVDLSERLSVALFDRELDATFQSGPFERRARSTVTLWSSPYVWVAAPELRLHGRALSLDDLAPHPILTHAKGTVPHQQMADHLQGLKSKARLLPSSNIATCLDLTLDGLGIACLPLDMLSEDLEAGRLLRLDYDWAPDDLDFAARTLLDPLPPYVAGAIELAVSLSASSSAADHKA